MIKIPAQELVPFSPCQAIQHLHASLRLGTRLHLSFEFEGDLAALVLPAGTGGRTDEIWRHTCVECFLQDGDGYFEVNVDSAGAWNVYRFDSYRAGMRPWPDAVLNDHQFTLSARSAHLSATLDLPHAARITRYNLCAICNTVSNTTQAGTAVESATSKRASAFEGTDTGPVTHFFALNHAGSIPDFHASNGFRPVIHA